MSNYPLTGPDNTGVGHEVMQENTAGTFNVAVGSQALKNNQTGNENAVVGYEAGLGNLFGDFNVAVGSGALRSNQTSDVWKRRRHSIWCAGCERHWISG